jgi:hypothetical protein
MNLSLNNNFIKVQSGYVYWLEQYVIHSITLEAFKAKYNMDRYIIFQGISTCDYYINKYNIVDLHKIESKYIITINFNNSTDKKSCEKSYDILFKFNNKENYSNVINEYDIFIRNKKLNNIMGYGLIKI